METQPTLEPSLPSNWCPSEDGKRVTETEYWQNYYEHEISYEWNNGTLEEKPMGEEKGLRVYNWIWYLLGEYFKVNPIGRVVNLETGFKIKHLTKGTAIRKPDLGIILKSNPTQFVEGEMSYHGRFDLCVESLSFSSLKEIKRDTVDKKREYAQTKVPEYYIFDSRGEETVFYRLNDMGHYERIPIIEGVVASKILPGFQFRISDLDELRPLEELMDDPVYSSFVKVDFQEEREAKEAERLRADQAEKRELEERQAKEDAEKRELEERQAKESERQAREKAEQRVLELEARLKSLEQGQ